MKTIFKILVIVACAVLVGSLFYGAVTATSSGANQSSLSARPTGEFKGHDRVGGAGGLQFPADSVKNFAIISVVGVIYLNAPKLFRRKKPAMQIAP